MSGLHFDITGDNSNFLRKLEEARNGVDTTSKKIEESGMSIEQLYRRMANAAAGFGVALSANEIISNVTRVRGEFQQLEVAFNTMLGSEEKANALMSQLVGTAAKTPFDLQGVANGAKQLLAYGASAEDVNGTLVRLGDIAAGLSIPLNDLVWLYGTTMTQGRLFTQDLRQFQGRGIPLADELAKQFGVTKDKVGELVTAGKIGFPEVQKAIEAMTNEGGKFGGLMDAQSKTITGQISNIEDAIDVMYNNIGKSSEGFINEALSGVSYLIENYEEIGKIIIELAGAYGVYKAILITITALQKVNSVVLAQATIEQNLCAIAGHKLSDAQAIVAARTKLLSIAQNGLVKSLKAVGSSLLANPYVLVAAAITGVSFAIYKVVTAENEFDKATKRLNEANSDIEKSLASEVSKLTSLERKLSEVKQGTEDYNNIKKTIVDNYGQYYKGLDGEIDRVGNLSSVYGKLVENMRLSIGQRKFESFFKAEQDNLDKIIGDNLDNAYEKLIESYGNEKGTKLYQSFFNAAIRGEDIPKDDKRLINRSGMWSLSGSASKYLDNIKNATQASAKALDDFKAKYQMTDKDVDNILSGKSTIVENVDSSSITKEIADATKKISDLKQELADLRSGKTTVEAGKTVQSVIEDKAKELKATEDALATLTGKDKSSDKKFEDEQKKQLEKQKAISKELLDLRLQNQQAEINQMNDGSEKKIAQINLDYDKEIAAILAKEKEWKDAQGGKLTEEQTVEIRTSLVQSYVKREKSTGLVSGEQLAEEKRMMNEYLKEYGTYLEKRQAITELYNERIRKATTEGEKLSLGEEMKKALATVDDEAQKKTSIITKLFSDMSKRTVADIRAIADEAQRMLDYVNKGEFKTGSDGNGLFGLTKEQFDILSESPEKLQAIKDEIANVNREADRCETTLNKISGGLKKVFSAGDDTKKLNEGLAEISEGMNDVMQAGQFLSDTFAKLGDAFGSDLMSGITDGLNVAMDAMDSAMQGAKAGAMFGQIGMAAGAAIGVVSSLAASIAKIHDKKNEKRIERLQDQIDTLDKSYDKLGDSIERAYSKDASKLIEDQNKLLEQQKVLIQQQIREEQDKKKTDKGRIKEWQDQIDEINNTIADNKEKAVDAIFGKDLKSAIDDFAQAYVDAWAAGEDRAKSMKDIAKNMIKQMIVELIKSKDGIGPAVEQIRDKLLEFWKDGVITEGEQAIIDKMVEDAANSLDGKLGWADKYLKGDDSTESIISSDSISDTIIDGLKSGKSGIKDFASSFEDMMREAVLNSLKTKYLEGPLKEFQKKFSELSESGGQLTASEIEELRNMYADIISGAKDQFDSLKEISGLDFTGDSDNSLKGAFAKASQESIDLLAGQTGAVRVLMEDIRGSMQPIREQMRLIYEMQSKGWEDVRAIRELSGKVEKNTEQIADNTKEIKDIAGKISENTRGTVDALEGTINVKVKM